MAQNIEFFLHPPSPKLTSIDTTITKLPPVSTLLRQEEKEESISDLPMLCLPSSPSSSHHSLEAVEPSSTSSYCYSPSLSPFMGSLSLDSPPQLSPQTSPFSSHLLLPPPTNTRRSRSLSNASTNSTSSFHSSISSCLQSDTALYDDEVIIIEEQATTQKRKRGRPPNSTRPSAQQQRDSYTFVTPTVWDVKQKEEELAKNSEQHNEDYVVLHWPQAQSQQQQQQQTDGQNIFTNIKMDTTLSMPKKKRGRKPKMQLAGNFCFVWRDLTAPRGANKKK